MPSGAPEPLAIDFVSPLPPVRSGISDYSRDLLPRLERLADVRVVRLPGQEVSPELEALWHPVAATETGSGGRLPLYQMGNNRHHEGVLALALERPGVLTLHDVVLHHLLVESTLGSEDLDAYRERLVADHGWIGAEVARARRWGELGSSSLFELPAHRGLLRRQRGVLVHSRWAAELIEEENDDVAVRVVPMGVPLPDRVDVAARAAFRRRHGLPADRPILGSFGFQTPIKRTEVVIAAMARPELAEAHLVVAGEVSPSLDFERRAREAGVADRVHVTGFLPFDEFEAAIAACDLCVNLRYPTAGETSASLLRVLAVGRPVVVSDYAQFAELPEAVAVRTPLGDGEAEALAAAVGEILVKPGRLAEMGRAARELVRERHDPGDAATSVVEACRELASLEPPGDLPLVAPPPTTLTWLRLDGAMTVEGAATPWAEGEARRLEVEITNRGPATWLATDEAPGSVLVETQWRPDRAGAPTEQLWTHLPRDVAAGESFRFEQTVRRPLGAGMLVIEPHVVGASGFGDLGGPVWTLELA